MSRYLDEVPSCKCSTEWRHLAWGILVVGVDVCKVPPKLLNNVPTCVEVL